MNGRLMQRFEGDEQLRDRNRSLRALEGVGEGSEMRLARQHAIEDEEQRRAVVDEDLFLHLAHDDETRRADMNDSVVNRSDRRKVGSCFIRRVQTLFHGQFTCHPAGSPKSRRDSISET